MADAHDAAASRRALQWLGINHSYAIEGTSAHIGPGIWPLGPHPARSTGRASYKIVSFS